MSETATPLASPTVLGDAHRAGVVKAIGNFKIFIADDYGAEVKAALENGHYERLESRLVSRFVRSGDRVLELGTALGLVTLAAASIVGRENVRTYDGNPGILEDAKANFVRNGLSGVDARLGLLAARSQFAPGRLAEFGVSREFWASRRTSGAAGFERTVFVPELCLEDEIAEFGANVLICDIEGGEVPLLREADLSGLRLIILEIHYWAQGERATDKMVRRLIVAGFPLHLMASRDGVLVFRRHAPAK